MEVKHFIACVDTLRIRPLQPQRWLLHDVHFFHRFDSELGPPFVVEKVSLLTRFYGGHGTKRFRLRVHWEHADGRRVLLRVMTSNFLEFDTSRAVEDYVFAIYDLHVPDVGLLEFELTAKEEPETILASEYLQVQTHE